MEETPQDILSSAQQAILKGDLQKAQDIVSSLTNKKGLSIQQRLKLSHELQWLGLPVPALKVLGKIAAPADFHLLAPEEFCLQVRAVYMLNFMGATYVARRLLERIEDHLIAQNIDLSGYHFSLQTYKAFILYESARYQEALESFEQIVESCKEIGTKVYLALHYIVCLEATGKVEEAIAQAEKYFKLIPEESDTLKAMYLQNLGRIEIQRNDLKRGQDLLDQALDIFDKNHKNKDQAYAMMWRGIAFGKEANTVEAKRILNMAWEILHHPLSQPQAQLSVLYWQEKLGLPIDLGAKVAIRCHSCIHSFSYLLGKPIHDSPYPLHARVEAEANALSSHDCWLVRDHQILPMKYSDIDLNNFSQVLDLYSGVQKDLDQRETYTEIQVRAMIAALGSGPIGIHEFAFVDFIYRQDFWDWQSGKERLKKLVQYLRKKGIPLYVNNQVHYLDIEHFQSHPLIIPMKLDFQGHHHFVKGHTKSFTRFELEEILGTKKTNASLLLKDWIKQGILKEADKDGAKIYYDFVK
ncbi:MAG: hypothetical protein CME71_07065 [Halobacteriovorax sp.]|nr:hypothetical protein [Halobacteriovorax sp.]